ncbi:MAG TPA: carbohydrate ABC transporter permease [Oceanithermus profundus]|uniref:Carbohydrate ABC transporter permease n=1 Tax=Oceanithermus profundus TaxID=187137 RepID=A0A7C4V6N3_9DEIN|nr:carbohydrate ABC transporter permease [Oceanithermus profundus]
MRRRRWWSTLLFYLLLAFILLYLVFPFYWAVVSSLKSPQELFETPVRYWPAHPRWQNYVDVFTQQPFGRNLLNSTVVAGLTTLLSLLVGSTAAYALGRFRFMGKRTVFFTVLSVAMFPQISVLGGMFVLIRSLGLYNTWWALVLAYMIFTLPFTIWVLTSFIREIPRELEEAAFVDGASPVQVLRIVLLPLMAPGLVTAGLLAFIQAWNEFLFALTFTIDNSARTVPVAIALFSGASQYELPWAQIMAASVIVTVPLIVLVLVFQQRLVSGLTAGAVKG